MGKIFEALKKAEKERVKLIKKAGQDPSALAVGDGEVDPHLVAYFDRMSPITEQYRSLRTSLTTLHPENPPRAIVFTSANPREGKTTTALNLAITLALHHPQCRVYAADLSADCVRLTERNIAHFGVTGRVEAAQGDLLEPFDTLDFHAAVDLLTCNPPYISARKLDTMHREIRDFEPRLAFDGGPLGVSVLYRLIKEAPRFLKQGGWLAFEVGLGQGPSVVKRMEKSGDYREVRSVADAAGDIRAVLART